MRRSLLSVVVVLTLATVAQAWETTIGEGKLDDGLDVVVDAAGDVVTAGGLAPGGQDFAVVKLDGLTGAEIWRYVASGSLGEPDFADQVAVDGSGDVFAIGFIREPGTEASVVKLDGTTGAEIWRRDLPDALPAGTATWVVVAGSGDPVVATGLSVRRLDGASGADVWAAATGSCLGGPLAIQGTGDVIATHLRSPSLPDGVVCRRDAASGAIVWSTNLGNTSVLDLALGGADDVVIGGHFDNFSNWTAAKLDGATGGVAWRVDAGLGGNARAVDVDSAGDVIVGGAAGTSNRLFAKLDGTSGATLWQTLLSDSVVDVAVDGNDDVIAAEVGSGFAPPAFVVKVDGTDGSALWLSRGGFPLDLDAAGQPVSLSDPLLKGWRVIKAGGPLAGRSFLVYDAAQATKLVVKAKDSAVLSPTGGLGTFGATLEILNPTTLESVSIPLPAAGWFYSNGWSYSDKVGAFGPCSKVKLKVGKLLRVVCKGIGFTLDESMQGSLRATLEMAGDPRSRQCVEFGGTVAIDAPGAFKALDSPPPAVCP